MTAPMGEDCLLRTDLLTTVAVKGGGGADIACQNAPAEVAKSGCCFPPVFLFLSSQENGDDVRT